MSFLLILEKENGRQQKPGKSSGDKIRIGTGRDYYLHVNKKTKLSNTIRNNTRIKVRRY